MDKQGDKTPNESCELKAMKCVPCRGGVPPLTDIEQRGYLKGLRGWEIVRSHHLHRVFEFPNFKLALAWINDVGALAESEGHHPDISVSYKMVTLDIFTHKIDGLTVSDFVLAAKIDALPGAHKASDSS